MSDPCRREGIKPHSYYAWTKEFIEAGMERLTRDAVRDATGEEVQQLKREDLDLKQLAAELPLDGYRPKKRTCRCPMTISVPEDERHGEGTGPRYCSLFFHTKAQYPEGARGLLEHLLLVAEAE